MGKTSPCCGVEIDTTIPDPVEAKPGDFAICEKCGRFLRFDADLVLRIATDVDLRTCPSEALRELDRFARLVRVRLREARSRW